MSLGLMVRCAEGISVLFRYGFSSNIRTGLRFVSIRVNLMDLSPDRRNMLVRV